MLFYIFTGFFLLAVNFIFISEKVLGLFLVGRKKGLMGRCFELTLIYFSVLLGLRLAEIRNYGTAYTQGWEFYVILICMFAVAVFPGFVYRSLRFKR